MRSSAVPVLLISAVLTEPEHRDHGRRSGASGYLVEPVSGTELVRPLRALLGAA